MKKIKVIHLFSGIGAPEMALKRAGIPIDIIGYSEIDKYAVQAYKSIHGDTPINFGDICKIEKLPKCNMLIYGSPCQDFSSAGRQKGLFDNDGSQTRSGLLFEVERLLNCSELPEILLMENVKNLVSKKFKPDFDSWLLKLEQLGYNNYWKVLNSKDFNVPQNRERVFVLSIKKEIDKKRFQFPIGKGLNLHIKDIMENNVDEKYYLSEEIQKRFFDRLLKSKKILNGDLLKLENCSKDITSQAGNVYDINGISPTLTAGTHGYAMGNILEEPMIVASRGRYTGEDNSIEQNYEPNLLGISNTLTTVQKDNLIVEGYYPYPNSDKKHQSNIVYSKEGISPTLDTMGGGNRQPKILDGTKSPRIRKLTPLECWRLMGVSDEDYMKVKKDGMSDTQLYKQAGNSIVVDVLEAIFKELFQIS